MEKINRFLHNKISNDEDKIVDKEITFTEHSDKYDIDIDFSISGEFKSEKANNFISKLKNDKNVKNLKVKK